MRYSALLSTYRGIYHWDNRHHIPIFRRAPARLAERPRQPLTDLRHGALDTAAVGIYPVRV